jgi:hypothetical protein
MKGILMILFAVTLFVRQAHGDGGSTWYTGDERCPPPKDDGTYSAPYDAFKNPHDYPTFFGADTPGWSCSYQREDGVIVQFGNSLSPQQQWLAIYGGGDGNDNN